MLGFAIDKILFRPRPAGDDYPTTPKQIPGYNIIAGPEQQRGRFSAEPTTRRIPVFFQRHFSGDLTLPTFLFSHGNAEILSDYIAGSEPMVHSPIEILSRNLKGNVCMYDYTGYGLTFDEEKPSEEACIENIRYVHKYMTEPKNHGGLGLDPQNIILMGHSMGTGPTVALAKILDDSKPFIRRTLDRDAEPLFMEIRLLAELRGDFERPRVLQRLIEFQQSKMPELTEAAAEEAIRAEVNSGDIGHIRADLAEISPLLRHDMIIHPGKYMLEKLPLGVVLVAGFQSAVAVVGASLKGSRLLGDRFKNFELIRDVHFPTLFVHDKGDIVIDYSNSEVLYDLSGASPIQRKLVLFESPARSVAAHMILITQKTHREISDFFDLNDLAVNIRLEDVQVDLDDRDIDKNIRCFYSTKLDISMLFITMKDAMGRYVNLALYVAYNLDMSKYNLILERVSARVVMRHSERARSVSTSLINTSSLNDIIKLCTDYFTFNNRPTHTDRYEFTDRFLYKSRDFVRIIFDRYLYQRALGYFNPVIDQTGIPDTSVLEQVRLIEDRPEFMLSETQEISVGPSTSSMDYF